MPLYNLDKAQVCHRSSLKGPALLGIMRMRSQVGECALPGDLFNVPVRVDLLHRVVRWQRAKKQQVQLAQTQTLAMHNAQCSTG